MRRLLDWVPVALGIALLSTLVGLQWHRIVRGQNDFVALYVGGRLVGTPDLYSRSANEAMIQSLLGGTMESVTYTRPPFYAALLKPLASLPYLAAYGVFFVACIAGILWFVVRFSKDCPALPLLASFSIPVAAVLPQGQDTPLLLVLAGGSLLLSRRKRDFLAGLLLSLCAIKFHLFLLVPLLLLAKKRWRILAGASLGCVVLFFVGIFAAGTKSTGQYVKMLRDPWINFSPDMMPNLHGLAMSLGAGPWVETGLACAVVGTFLWICQRTDDYEFLFAVSVLCGLLVSYHSGVGDDVLLLLVVAVIASSSAAAPANDKALRMALAVTVTPLPYFTGISLSIVLPLLFLLILGLAAVSVARRQKQALMVPAAA